MAMENKTATSVRLTKSKRKDLIFLNGFKELPRIEKGCLPVLDIIKEESFSHQNKNIVHSDCYIICFTSEVRTLFLYTYNLMIEEYK